MVAFATISTVRNDPGRSGYLRLTLYAPVSEVCALASRGTRMVISRDLAMLGQNRDRGRSRYGKVHPPQAWHYRFSEV